MIRCTVILALALAGCATQPMTTGSIAAPVHMASGQQVAPPAGFVALCLRDHTFCDGGTDRPASIELTPAHFAELDRVNGFVNALPELTDEDRYGVAEYWTVADDKGGDCEDLALRKRAELIRLGWPADALLLTTVREWNGEGHAVLTVVTDQGDYILDNKNPLIVQADQAPYVWVARQSRKRPYIWVDLDPHTFMNVAVTYPPLGAPVPFIAAVSSAHVRTASAK